MQMLRSLETEINQELSGVKASWVTVRVWPSSCCTAAQLPSCHSQIAATSFAFTAAGQQNEQVCVRPESKQYSIAESMSSALVSAPILTQSTRQQSVLAIR